MNWLTWSLLGTGAYVVLKRPAAAAELPKPPKTPAAVTVNVNPVISQASPKTIVKTTSVDGRKYTITRAGLGIYRVELSSSPGVFYELDQNGPLRSSADSAALTQLKSDLSRFPAALFK